MGGDEEPHVIVNVSKPEGLAVDYTSGKIYWTDAESNELLVANVDGSHKKVLVRLVFYLPFYTASPSVLN